jgi:nitroimidazol reductase NimA-like FMN-containing flavoprotein (pyridoxamine 5'-phosphate oxidase superfamily)
VTDVIELSYEESLALLATESVGRIAVHADPYPLVFPVNYKLVDGRGPSEPPGHAWIAIRTRPGNTIDRAPMFVSFEIDGVEHARHTGWSVIVTGTLHRVDERAADFDERFDPEPWIGEERDRWLVIHPTRITGRRLGPDHSAWAFPPAAYL